MLVPYPLPFSFVKGPLFLVRDPFLLVPVSCRVCRILQEGGVGGVGGCLRNCLFDPIVRGLLLGEGLDLAARIRSTRRNILAGLVFCIGYLAVPEQLPETFREPSVPWFFWRLLMDCEQPASLYRFPVGGTLSDIFVDIDDSFCPLLRACTQSRC